MTHQAADVPDFLARLIDRAMKDAAFRQRLVSTPKAAIEQELGITVPDGTEIVVVEETPTTICLVLPAREQRAGNRELSDEELSVVAGGTDELGAGAALQLQQLMDRRSKQMSVLSNMLEKIGETPDSITQNLK